MHSLGHCSPAGVAVEVLWAADVTASKAKSLVKTELLSDVRWLLDLNSRLGGGGLLLLGLSVLLTVIVVLGLGRHKHNVCSGGDLGAMHVSERVVSGGSELVADTFTSLGLLALGETDDAAAELSAQTLANDRGVVLRALTLNKVVVILALVDDNSASNDAVRSAKLNERVTAGVYGLVFLLVLGFLVQVVLVVV